MLKINFSKPVADFGRVWLALKVPLKAPLAPMYTNFMERAEKKTRFFGQKIEKCGIFDLLLQKLVSGAENFAKIGS